MEPSKVESLFFQLIASFSPNSQRLHDAVHWKQIEELVNSAKPVFETEPTLLRLEGCFYIIGDIHGNINDLIRIFELCGYPPDTKYLFLGDYVDRGNFSVEVMVFLLSHKLLFPEHVYLLRGNHEIEDICSQYGFYDEIETKYHIDLFQAFINMFLFLPIAAIINNSTFCVHGGIGPHVLSLRDVSSLKKDNYIDKSPIFNELLWSDPKKNISGFTSNPRGLGSLYGKDILEKFLQSNNLTQLIRSHEVCSSGYHYPYGDNKSCITIFSSSDYCGQKNCSSVAQITSDSRMLFLSLDPLSKNIYKRKRVTIPNWLLERIYTSSDLRISDIEGEVRSFDSEESPFLNYIF